MDRDRNLNRPGPMQQLEKWLNELRKLLYESKGFTVFLIIMVVLLFVAFPNFMLWIVVSSLVFVFIKGVILILKMINNR